ncbi:MAG TPA: hypothetical protein VNB64_00640 [Solirubrobacteraceae bacterium]|nr:hypothetical protein [Solirubrobacteraceae bacterium]
MGRRSRKRAATSSPPAKAREGNGGSPQRSLRSPRRASSEERNERIRAALEPLEPGERPAAVTVAAIVAALLALANLIAYMAGLKIDGERPALSGIVVYEGLLLAAAAGMWRAKYWAVLGFQFMLGFLLVILALLLVRASNVLAVVVVLAIGLPSGWLFWKLVRAMARIQMPDRPGANR